MAEYKNKKQKTPKPNQKKKQPTRLIMVSLGGDNIDEFPILNNFHSFKVLSN